MVTKTKLGLVCAALMMILGTQGVDAQLLTRQSQPLRVGAGKSSELKVLQKAPDVAEGNAVKIDGFKSPMNRAPRRVDSPTAPNVTHTKAWWDNLSYTWTDANNVQHPNTSYTDEVTDPYQIYGFIHNLYSNPAIPGIHYSTVWNEPLLYRFPWELEITNGRYSTTQTPNDIGWGLYGTDPMDVTTPTENGYTVCLVKVKDEALDPGALVFGKSKLIDSIGKNIEAVQLLTDGLRVDEGGPQAGTVFSYTGELNRFFFISKGKNYDDYVYSSPQNPQQLSSVTFNSTSAQNLQSPWSGRISYQRGSGWLSSAYYYIANVADSITYTIPNNRFSGNAYIQVVVNASSSGYIYINTKYGIAVYEASSGANTYTLTGTFKAGDKISIFGCTVNNNTGVISFSTNPHFSSSGIQINYSTTAEYVANPTIAFEDEELLLVCGYAPFYDMFEEFSPTSTASGSEITDFYPTMMQGGTYPVEHDCLGVICLEHYFSMSGKKGTEEKSLSNLVFYIPDNRAEMGQQVYDETTPPMVGLYVIQLEASIAPDDEQKEHTFDVTVNWESSLDNITSCTVPQTYELHAYWTDPVTGVEKDSVIYTGPNTTYTYEVPQFMASYTIDYKVKATPTDATNPDEFYAWSNIDDVIVPGYDDFFMLDRDHYESDFVITSEKNFYRNFLYPKNKDVGGFTPQAIEGGMKHFILYRQSTDEGGEPVPAADLYFETANGKVYYKIEYRDEYQHPINSNNN